MDNIKTGFDELDSIIGGLKKGQLIMTAGRPQTGTETFTMKILLNALRKNNKALVFSLEMPRILYVSSLLELDSDTVLPDDCIPDDLTWESITESAVRLSESGLYIDDTPLISAEYVRNRLESLQGISLVVIDYLALMRDMEKSSRRLEVKSILNKLKELATEFDIPIIIMSGVSKSCEKRMDRRPVPPDIMYSEREPELAEAISEIPDVILFTYRDIPRRKESGDEAIETEIIIARHPDRSDLPKSIRVFL